MRARRIIEGAAFGPEVVRTTIEAFEAAWSEIAERFDSAGYEAARESLAKLIISSAREDSNDANLLKGAALRAMERAFPDQFTSPFPSSDKVGKKGS